mmetsp:Transcript_21165/g.53796  ORF Transcript_21165/g.53796 Transcript_21165/m.53796 type:complete len:305 (+) Transcript_21165:25-939(+)
MRWREEESSFWIWRCTLSSDCDDTGREEGGCVEVDAGGAGGSAGCRCDGCAGPGAPSAPSASPSPPPGSRKPPGPISAAMASSRNAGSNGSLAPVMSGMSSPMPPAPPMAMSPPKLAANSSPISPSADLRAPPCRPLPLSVSGGMGEEEVVGPPLPPPTPSTSSSITRSLSLSPPIPPCPGPVPAPPLPNMPALEPGHCALRPAPPLSAPPAPVLSAAPIICGACMGCCCCWDMVPCSGCDGVREAMCMPPLPMPIPPGIPACCIPCMPCCCCIIIMCCCCCCALNMPVLGPNDPPPMPWPCII